MFNELDPTYERLREECRYEADPYDGQLESMRTRIREQDDRMATLLTFLIQRRVLNYDEAVSVANGATVWVGEGSS